MDKDEQLYRLIWLSRPLMQAAEAVVERGLDGTGLTVRTRAILEILSTHGEATVPDIARALEINRQYVQLMVNETLAEKLTIKQANPRHKRSTKIALTQKGRALIEKVVCNEMELVRAMAEHLKSTDIETALVVTSTLIERLKSNTGEPRK